VKPCGSANFCQLYLYVMKSNNYLRTLFIFLVLSLSIGCDQASKVLVRHNMGYYNQYKFFYQHITLQRVENSGAFLSFGDSLTSTQKDIFLNILPFLMLLLGLVFIFRKKSLDLVNLFGITLIIGGGFGNLYDRVLYGSVTDFLHVKFGIFQTGVFNAADICIMVGMFIILIKTLFKNNAVPEKNISSTDSNL